MNRFNEKFYALLDQNENDNNNVIELLKMCKSPGIKMDIETKIVYVMDLVYQYYQDATTYEKEQINKLLELKFEKVSYEEFDDLIFYKQQLDYIEEEEKYYDERDDRTCIFGYNCEYECEASSESFY
jgi:organic radical activating enzyme